MTYPRRIFLAQSAALLLPAASPIRIAFLGAAHSHAEGKLQVLKKSPDFTIAGLWEPDASLSKRYLAQGITSLTLEQILADKTITAVAVESAVKSNAVLALQALEADKHVHLEKPPSAKAGELERIVQLARRKNKILQIGYMWRYHPGVNFLVEAVAAGALGQVYSFDAVIDTKIGDERRPEWALFHGGHMFELGAHVIEVMVRILGAPAEVTSTLAHHGGQKDSLNDNTLAVFRFPSALGMVRGSTLQPRAGRHRRIEVRGTNGVITLQPIEPHAVQIDFAAKVGSYEPGRREISLPAYTRYAEDFVNFTQAIQGRGQLPVSLDHEIAVQNTLLRACGMS
jgi:predicted dehydrogenase